MRAYLVLEDGSIYPGKKIGCFKETVCELVINTSMTGYLEALTDPSFSGLGLLMTYPLVGNYGVNPEDFESNRPAPSALVLNEICSSPSNFRSKQPLEAILLEHAVAGISNIDTRAVVKKLREKGSLKAILTDDFSNLELLFQKMALHKTELPDTFFQGAKPQILGGENKGPNLAVFDCGMKNSQIKALEEFGFKISLYPLGTRADEIGAGGHDALVIAGGAELLLENEELTAKVQALLSLGLPTFAIGLGHLLVALALGGSLESLGMGHRGSNHPVRFPEGDRTYVTVQNHAMTVSAKKLPESARILCENINDKSVEGLEYDDRPLFSVQFYPDVKEASHTTAFLFKRFMNLIEGGGAR